VKISELLAYLLFVLVIIWALMEKPLRPSTKERMHTYYLLARIIFAEAAGEPYEGKVAVGCVIRNRVKSPRWPNTYEKVIYQYKQFPGVNSPLWYLFDKDNELTEEEQKIKQQCLEIAKKILLNKQPDITCGATHYYNPKKASPSWAKKMKITRRIGNHIFLKER